MIRHLLFLGVACFLTVNTWAQAISGTIYDERDGSTVIGANIVEKGTTNGAATDFDGNFTITPVGKYPVTLEITFIGLQKKEVVVDKPTTGLKINLSPDTEVLAEVDVIEKRLSEKQRSSALTVEALDALAIKETAAPSFYEGLGNLKGVDLTSASIGFKVINTRGFNSTSPVRSLQIIDGVDNQAPGLNFSLGNFLGASELDVINVDIIAGASSAYYGPGAFNGVISMQTKNPFDFQGLSASVKGGERNLFEGAVRWADGFKIGDVDYDNFAYKINLYYLRADDWVANNFTPIYNSDVPANNPGRFDAINIYGDEDLAGGNDYRSLVDVLDGNAGLGKFYRSGYEEPDLVDYNTQNLKTNLGLYYRFSPELQLSYTFNYGTGTTVYQGENRFSLKGIQFFQNIVELKKENTFFIRAYATHEDAGDSYDAVLTAFKMNEEIASNENWNTAYKTVWNSTSAGFKYGDSTLALTGTPADHPNLTPQEWYDGPYQDSLAKYNDKLVGWHENVLDYVNTFSYPRPEVGTDEFNQLFEKVTNRTFTEGGSKFYDKSALYHVMGEYQFHPSWGDIRVGGNFRQYRPDSRGNIFDEMVLTSRIENGVVVTDTSFRTIINSEYGMYAGIEKKFNGEQFKVAATIRGDKNQNFDLNISPAVSVIYNVDETNTLRLSFSSAIRNPTLSDQYLRYDVGRAILLGNLNGYDSLVTLESFDDFRSSLNRDDLEYFDVDPIQPERVQTIELGYRGTMFKKLYVDASYYHNWYTNFIGFQFGLDVQFLNGSNVPQFVRAYRVSANSKTLVTSQGFNIGLNYYLNNELTLNGNYSWNKLFIDGERDPIVPAFNTPEHKFNIGLTGRGYNPFKGENQSLGFNVTYKWVQGFLFEGSPQFTGFIDDYGLLDAQVSYSWVDYYTTLKVGASNLLNNQVFQVYGGPTVGRLTYVSLLFELN
ncbi:MAG: TonB-dependent receptor [Schleiferiaceae bacterium]